MDILTIVVGVRGFVPPPGSIAASVSATGRTENDRRASRSGRGTWRGWEVATPNPLPASGIRPPLPVRFSASKPQKSFLSLTNPKV